MSAGDGGTICYNHVTDLQPLQALLQDIIGGATLEHVDGMLLAEHAGDEDERRMRHALTGDCQRFDAGEHRHHEVREDHIEVGRFEGRYETLFRIDDLHVDLIVGAFQLGQGQFRVERVVFY